METLHNDPFALGGNRMSDFTEFYLPIILVLVICIGGTLTGVYFYERHQCVAQSKLMGFEWSYGLVQDCMINVNGTWIPIDNYRLFQEQK